MTWRPSFPKRTSNFDSSDHRTVFHFATVHFNEPWPRENACASGSCLDMASFLTYRVWAATANGAMDCVHRQCFLEVFLSPCCDFHYSSIPVCVAVPSKGPKITGIQYGFPALISCKLVLQLFLICTFNFSGPLIATCPNFFGMCSSHEIQNEPIFGMTFQNVSHSTLILLSIFYCE